MSGHDAAAVRDKIAEVVWSHYGPDHQTAWSEVRSKGEYHNVADRILAILADGGADAQGDEVERVAKALFDATADHPDDKRFEDTDSPKFWRRLAGAAIGAMAERGGRRVGGWIDGHATKPPVGKRGIVAYKRAVQCGSYWDTWSGEKRDNWCRDQSSVYFPETEPGQLILWQPLPEPPTGPAGGEK